MGRALPGWVVDGLLAALVALLAVALERATQGRLDTAVVAGWVAVGSFVLLRVGARLARAGRTLGCAFVFAVVWLLPCAFLLLLALSSEWQRIVRDSSPLFLSLSLLLIGFMAVTFERVRRADMQRFPTQERGDAP